MSDAKVHIDAGNELHGAVVETNSYIVNISRQYARIYSYDDYLSTAGEAEPTAQPTNLVFSSVTSSGMTLTWTAASPAVDGYIVLRSTSAISDVPVDLTNYSVNDVIGSSTVEFLGAGVTFDDSGLSAYTTYYYSVFSYNGTTGTYNFLTTAPLTGSQLTLFVFGNALHFNGSNSRVDLTDTAIFNGQTEAAFLFWMKQDASVTGSTQYILSKQKTAGTGRAGIRVGVAATDKLAVLVENSATTGNVTFVGNSAMGTPTAWHHIAIFVNMTAGTCVMYVDNASYANTKTGTNAATLGTFTSHAGALGCLKTETLSVAGFFDGTIDDMVVYHSSDENLRTAHYGGGTGGNPSGSPYSHWRFNESNSSNTTADEIASNDGTLVNFSYDATSGFDAH